MNEVILKELWLHSVCGYEPECVSAVLSVFQSTENSFGIRTKESAEIKKLGLPGKFLKEYSDEKHLIMANKLLEYCDKKGIRIITMESAEYPVCLKNVYLPPRVLFAIGKRIDLENTVNVSVVGSRKATDKGLVAAERIGANLAQNGITVVSGMAEGIDAAAMNGALKAGGTVIAVLAGGVEEIYPKSNKGLYYRTLENGMVISERPPGTKVKRYFYQQRNRIIVGLSNGVVIAEGELKSGTAITARLATDNNRDVFAVPGSPTVSQAKLPNLLIYDGAAIIDRMERPADYYRDIYPDKVGVRDVEKVQSRENKGITGLNDEDLKIIEILKENGGAATVEMIAERCKIQVNRINARITILGIKGVIKQESGNRVLLICDIG